MRIGVGLSIPELSTRGGRFSPASLFTGGVQGAWYDPSDVLLNWRTNLLTYTQEFDNAAWTKSLTTATANSAIAPDGTTTADTIIPDTTSGSHRASQIVSLTSGVSYTMTVYVKAAGYSRVGLREGNFTGAYATFDLSSATLIDQGTGGVGSITSVGNDWYRISMTSVSGGVSMRFDVFPLPLSYSSGSPSFPYSGDGTSGIYVWGAQLELGSTATTYQAITTPEQTYLLYDPQPVLYQDSAGTTPVTAVEQPVGLMLDKSQGLVLGSELVTNGDFSNGSTGWSLSAGTVSGGALNISSGSAYSQIASQALTLTAGNRYKISITVSRTSGDFFVGLVGSYGAAISTGYNISSSGSFSLILSAQSGVNGIYFIGGGAGANLSIDNVSVKELPGNHATQSTAASRPVLRARYNLLTYSEQFDNAAWNKSACAIAANSIAAPDGTTTADTLTASAGLNFHYVTRNGPSSGTGQFVHSFYVKKNTATWIFFTVNDSFINYFNLDTGLFGTTPDTCTVVAEANGWYRISVVRTLSAANLNCGIGIAGSNGGANFTAAGTESIYVWGADLRTGSSAGTYQRIAAATDYATAGFLPYLVADGVDDSMVIPAAATSSATAMTEMHAAWRPAGFGSGNGVVFGGTGTGTTNDHEPFSDGNLYYGFASSSRQTFGSLGTVTTPYLLDATQTGTTLAAFRNGTQLGTTSTVSLGIGATPRLFVSNNSTLQYYQGNFFGGLMIKKVLSAAETSAARSWFAAKAGITL